MNTEQKEVLNEMIDKNDTKDNTCLLYTSDAADEP